MEGLKKQIENAQTLSEMPYLPKWKEFEEVYKLHKEKTFKLKSENRNKEREQFKIYKQAIREHFQTMREAKMKVKEIAEIFNIKYSLVSYILTTKDFSLNQKKILELIEKLD